MNAKERNEYSNFRRGNDKMKAPIAPDRPFRPVMFQNPPEQFGMQPQFGFGFPPGMGMGLPVNPNIPMQLPPAYRK